MGQPTSLSAILLLLLLLLSAPGCCFCALIQRFRWRTPGAISSAFELNAPSLLSTLVVNAFQVRYPFLVSTSLVVISTPRVAWSRQLGDVTCLVCRIWTTRSHLPTFEKAAAGPSRAALMLKPLLN